jgi:hypothetical protein
MPNKTDQTTRTATPATEDKPQIDKFKDLARELEADESEGAFDRSLKQIAKARGNDQPDKNKPPK